MTTEYSKIKWIEAGYEFFALHGPDHIQVEKLARNLNLNKSGFYHYFGDRDVFTEELLDLHKERIEVFARKITPLKNYDEYIHLIVNNKITTLFHVQLSRNRNIAEFDKTLDYTNSLIFPKISPLWSEYAGMSHHPEIAMRYFYQLIGVFVKSVNAQNLTYDFISALSKDAIILLKQIQKTRN